MTNGEKSNLLNELLEYEEKNDIGNLTRAERREFQQWISKTLEQEPKISLEAYKQVTKERDIAIEQLHELGYEFGEKIEPTTKNCGLCRYYGSHHEVCNYCYKCSLWTEEEPTTKNDLAVDCISRADALSDKGLGEFHFYEDYAKMRNYLKNLPSVTPQEPKKGHWINYDYDEDKYDKIKCSECGHIFIVDSYHWCDIGFTKDDLNYCPNCGARMIEPQ